MILNENDAKSMLSEYGISRPEFELIRGSSNENSVKKSFRGMKLKYPVVVKISGNNISHKTEMNGVKTDIRNIEELKKTVKLFRKDFPEHDILIEEHISHDVEFIFGIKNDQTFGHVIMFGAGGIFAEIYKDVVFRKMPIGKSEAKNAVMSTKLSNVFKGYRGIKTNPDLLVKVMTNISNLVEDNMEILRAIDINPLVFGKGKVIALDAKINIIRKLVSQQ